MSQEVRGALSRFPSPVGAWLFKRYLAAAVVVLFTIVAPVALILSSTVAKANTLQMSSDNLATGWYSNESRLSPTNVESGKFGELFDTQLSGEIYAQPLISQPTVLAVTENDYAYGLNAKTGSIEWQDNFGPPADPLSEISCGDLGGTMGITGTPVVDGATNTAYFVAAEGTGVNGATEWFMEAVNVQTGALASGWPAGGVQIQGSADNDPGTVFNGQYQLQRPGLVLVNGVVYAAFGSLCDYGNWEGWLVGVSESSASITTMWSTEEDVSDEGIEQPGGGIWESGSPPVVNNQGDIFVATGNGDVPAAPLLGNDADADTYGEAVVELSTSGGTLHPIDFFVAADAKSLNTQDGDLGSGGLVELPPSFGTKKEPDVMVIDGKQGILYVLNGSNLGGYQQGPNRSDDVPAEVGPYGGVWAKPAVWPGNGGYIYIPTAGTAGFEANGGSLNAFKRTLTEDGHVSFSLVAATSNNNDDFGYGSGSPIVTSDGLKSRSALVWVVHASSPGGVDSELEAYDAIPVKKSMEEVWSSGPFTSANYSQPGVDNGIIYVGTKDQTLLAFGLRSSKSPELTGGDVNFLATAVSQSTTLNAVFTASQPTTVTSFTVSGSYTIGSPSSGLPAFLSSGQSISVPVTFRPTALGANSGTLTANITGATSEVALTGQGTTPTSSFSISPEAASFSPQHIGGRPPAPIAVTFKNVSSNPIAVTGFSSPIVPFGVLDPPVDQTVAAKGILTFHVRFYPPISSGDFDHIYNSVATLETSVGNFGVAISASASAPANISTAPDVLNFGNVAVGSSSTLKFDLGDQGGFPLRIVRSTPPQSNGFIALTNPFHQLATTRPPDTIAPNTSIEEKVRFAPTTRGRFTAEWLFKGNDGNGVQRVVIVGTGTSP